MYSQLFSNQAQFFKALAHPRRLEIVNLLRDQELPVTDIYSMLDLPQSNISQHLMFLRHSGVVETKKVGRQIYYFLSDNRLVEAYELIRELLLDKLEDKDLAREMKLSMNELVPIKTDPVCHMRISAKTAGFSHQHKGETYYFCASGCVEKFKQEPGKYI
jgi:ArsR family transcriptional regulator